MTRLYSAALIRGLRRRQNVGKDKAAVWQGSCCRQYVNDVESVRSSRPAERLLKRAMGIGMIGVLHASFRQDAIG